jgi:drug/metabolite transporter (DMT)-like permease
MNRAGGPTPATLVAFVFFVLIGGSNFVAVRFTLRELPPFYGAGVRFGVASFLLLAIAAVARIALPRGRTLVGAIVYGLLNFFVAYAFFYWGAQRVPAALGAVIFGAVPLMTLLLAAVQGVERLQWRSILGGAIAVVGVLVTVGAPANEAVPLLYLGAVVVSAVGAAQTAIVLKQFPGVSPVGMNAVGMGVGAALLLVTSFAFGEHWMLPARSATWFSLAFLVPIGSVLLFVLYVFIVQHWTATAASFQFVLFPVVSAVVAALVAHERLDATAAIGGLLALLGVYLGALAGGGPRIEPAETPVGLS